MPYQRKYDFQAGTRISSSQVDEEFDQLIEAANNNEQNITDTNTAFATHQADEATQDYLGHVKLPENWKPITLLNGWVNASGGRDAKYYKDGFGTVYLCGMIMSGTTNNGTTIFSLPAGYRPLATRTILTRTFTTEDSYASISINPVSGAVTVSKASAEGLNLDGISFRAEG